jgi:hypothetical protein
VNENPRHDKCPAEADNWCQYRKCEATGKRETYDHPPPLHPDIEKHLIPIYTDLSNEDLLTRCLGGHTQNANESFNHLETGAKAPQLRCKNT